MSGSVPRVTGGSVLGAATASQLPNTGAGEVIVQVAAFLAIVLVTWILADKLSTSSPRV